MVIVFYIWFDYLYKYKIEPESKHTVAHAKLEYSKLNTIHVLILTSHILFLREYNSYIFIEYISLNLCEAVL